MTEKNLLESLVNISKSNNLDLTDVKYGSEERNRIQAVGAGFEVFIKDSFCGVPGTITGREEEYEKVFSWTGSKNNPPDAMLISSDAVEIKKHEGNASPVLALNSSPPRSKLRHDDSKIKDECRNAEEVPWIKDYLYSIGSIEDNHLKDIIFCYGDCFVAKDEIYQKPIDTISNSLKKLEGEGIEFNKTNELGKVSNIDPLDYSGLRIRGMWGLKSPAKIFENKINSNGNEKLLIIAIMRKEKYEEFPEKSKKNLLSNSFVISHFQSPDPDNPKNMIDLVIVKYSK